MKWFILTFLFACSACSTIREVKGGVQESVHQTNQIINMVINTALYPFDVASEKAKEIDREIYEQTQF